MVWCKCFKVMNIVANRLIGVRRRLLNMNSTLHKYVRKVSSANILSVDIARNAKAGAKSPNGSKIELSRDRIPRLVAKIGLECIFYVKCICLWVP